MIIINNTVPIAPDIIGITLEPLVLGLGIITDDVTTDTPPVSLMGTDTSNECNNFMYFYILKLT